VHQLENKRLWKRRQPCGFLTNLVYLPSVMQVDSWKSFLQTKEIGYVDSDYRISLSSDKGRLQIRSLIWINFRQCIIADCSSFRTISLPSFYIAFVLYLMYINFVRPRLPAYLTWPTAIRSAVHKVVFCSPSPCLRKWFFLRFLLVLIYHILFPWRFRTQAMNGRCSAVSEILSWPNAVAIYRSRAYSVYTQRFLYHRNKIYRHHQADYKN